MDYLTLKEIAKDLGRSLSCLHNLRQRGHFPLPDLFLSGRAYYKPETAKLIKEIDAKLAKPKYRKTTKEEIEKIEEMVDCGIRPVKIAELTGLHYCTVWRFVDAYKRKTGLKKPVDFVSHLKFN